MSWWHWYGSEVMDPEEEEPSEEEYCFIDWLETQADERPHLCDHCDFNFKGGCPCTCYPGGYLPVLPEADTIAENDDIADRMEEP